MHGNHGLAARQRAAAHADLANAAASLAEARMHRVRRFEQLRRRRLESGRCPIGIGNLRNVDLAGQQRLVAARLETPTVTGESGGKA